jgi:NAD(P)-dependent dehydrogenase (short-subunit alcohol dehydrogenase family)
MTDKVILVTGASSGIGEATTRQLRADGHIVYAAARRVERMANLVHDGIRVIPMDVTDDASIVAGVERIAHEAGRIDTLVNNAGYGSYGALEDVPLPEGRAQFDVNLFGLARLTQLVLPYMRRQGSGRIVNVSSMGGKIYEPLGGWYHATKFAVEGLSDSLRLELKPFGIDVVIIEPGGIRTEWSAIAIQKLLETSGATAYASQAERLARVLGNDRLLSDPEVVARAISAAVAARRPKTRYVVGSGARPLLAARRLLSDRMFDRLITMAFTRIAGHAPAPDATLKANQ